MESLSLYHPTYRRPSQAPSRIGKLLTLDSFRASAQSNTQGDSRKLGIAFTDSEATVTCIAPPEYYDWFEHFMIDLKKHLRLGTFAQGFFGTTGGEWGLIPILRKPHCQIVICKTPPSTLAENVKFNLIANLIWALLGALSLILGQWVLRTFGIDLSPFK